MDSLARAGTALRITYALAPLLTGADKIADRRGRWDKRVARPLARRLPMRTSTFVRLAGVAEMGLGALLLSGRTRLGGSLAAGYFALLAANRFLRRDYNFGALELQMGLAVAVLAALGERAAQRGKGIERTVDEALEVGPTDRPYVASTPELTH